MQSPKPDSNNGKSKDQAARSCTIARSTHIYGQFIDTYRAIWLSKSTQNAGKNNKLWLWLVLFCFATLTQLVCHLVVGSRSIYLAAKICAKFCHLLSDSLIFSFYGKLLLQSFQFTCAPVYVVKFSIEYSEKKGTRCDCFFIVFEWIFECYRAPMWVWRNRLKSYLWGAQGGKFWKCVPFEKVFPTEKLKSTGSFFQRCLESLMGDWNKILLDNLRT